MRPAWSLGQNVEWIDRILLCISKTFCVIHHVIKAGWSVDDGRPFGHKTASQQFPGSAQFRKGALGYGGDQEHYLPYYCEGYKTTNAAIPQGKKQTRRASPWDRPRKRRPNYPCLISMEKPTYQAGVFRHPFQWQLHITNVVNWVAFKAFYLRFLSHTLSVGERLCRSQSSVPYLLCGAAT